MSHQKAVRKYCAWPWKTGERWHCTTYHPDIRSGIDSNDKWTLKQCVILAGSYVPPTDTWRVWHFSYVFVSCGYLVSPIKSHKIELLDLTLPATSSNPKQPINSCFSAASSSSFSPLGPNLWTLTQLPWKQGCPIPIGSLLTDCYIHSLKIPEA